MESKLTSKMIVMLIAFSIISGCGYLDDDDLEYQKIVVENIKIEKQKYSKNNDLVFYDSNYISVIVEDCKAVYYDTTKNMIFVEKFVSEGYSIYYQIKVLDLSKKNVAQVIRKNEIYKDVFVEKIKSTYLVRYFRRP